MAFNVMDMIMDQVTPDNLKAVAGMLGEDESKVSSAISGAAPAILGGLVSSLGKPEGKQAFEQQLEQADGGLMGNLAGMLGGGGGNALVESGAGMLGSLLGDNKMGMLASAIGGFSGLSENSSKSLLGLAAPMVMGMLKSKGASDGLNVGGLMDMLMGQKDNIAKAVPDQLGSALSGSGLMDDVLGKAGATADTVAATATAAAATTAAVGKEAADKGGSFLGKLLPIIILAVVAWLAWQFFLKPDPAPGNAVPGSAVGAAQLSDQLGNLMGQAGSILSGIDSVDEARSAVAGLQSVDQGLGQLVQASSSLPAAQAAQLAESFAKLAPDMEKAVAHAYAIPGVRDVLAGPVDSILRKLKVVSGT